MIEVLHQLLQVWMNLIHTSLNYISECVVFIVTNSVGLVERHFVKKKYMIGDRIHFKDDKYEGVVKSITWSASAGKWTYYIESEHRNTLCYDDSISYSVREMRDRKLKEVLND
jgi:hypothetical protein